MDTAVAVHRSATAFIVVLAAMALMAKDNPEALVLLAMTCADPSLLATAVIMTVLAMPETTERKD